MPGALEAAVGQMLMLSFQGTTLPAEMVATLRRQQVGGVTLFRSFNVESPAQVRALTGALQAAAAASGQPPLLIGADQEGGQLMAIGDGATPFPGNMALGATRSESLAERAGAALGRELAALGINVNYAPVCDVNVNPRNPVVGTRSFGEEPALVARLGAAMVRGIQSAGVAATAKHFPGHGDTSTDSHHGAPTLPHDAARLREVEFPPFQAAIEAGVRLVMTAHVSLPALNGGRDLPATLSPTILEGILRREMGFQGVIISDAMDMHAIAQGPALFIEAIAAAAAGVDLLTLTTFTDQAQVYAALCQAARRGLLPQERVVAAAERLLEVKRWLYSYPQPPLEVVGCAAHQALALEIAREAITLVRDEAGLLPLRLPADGRVAALVAQPADLTPADTSSFVRPAMAEAMRRFHPRVDELSMPLSPTEAEVGALAEALTGYDLVVVGTINASAYPAQAAVVEALLRADVPVVAVALRMPYDLHAYPMAPTYLCTYSIQPPAMQALAEALWGEIACRGRLPVSLDQPAPVA